MPKLDIFNPSQLLLTPPVRPPCWIGPALLPQSAKLLIGGCTKVGKSWQIMEFARALVTGTPLFGYDGWPVPSPCNVLLLDKELGLYTLLDRWRQFVPGVSAEAAARLEAATVRTLQIDADDESEKVIVDAIGLTSANVLIVDPINRFMSSSVIENDTIRRFMDRIDRILDATTSLGTSCVLVHHFNKRPTKLDDYDTLDEYNFAGGATWVNVADSILCVARSAGHGDNRRDPGGNEWWQCDYRTICRHAQSGDRRRIEIKPSEAGSVVRDIGPIVPMPMKKAGN